MWQQSLDLFHRALRRKPNGSLYYALLTDISAGSLGGVVVCGSGSIMKADSGQLSLITVKTRGNLGGRGSKESGAAVKPVNTWWDVGGQGLGTDLQPPPSPQP